MAPVVHAPAVQARDVQAVLHGLHDVLMELPSLRGAQSRDMLSGLNLSKEDTHITVFK